MNAQSNQTIVVQAPPDVLDIATRILTEAMLARQEHARRLASYRSERAVMYETARSFGLTGRERGHREATR